MSWVLQREKVIRGQGAAIALSVLAFNMLGDDGLRDLLDPRLR